MILHNNLGILLDIYLSVAVRYLPNDLGLLITDGCHYRKDQPIKCKWTEVVGQLVTDVQTMDVSNTLNHYITCVMTNLP